MSDDPKKPGKDPSLDRLPAARPPRPSYADWSEEESSTRTTESAIVLTPPWQKATRRALLTVISGPNAGRAYSVNEGETSIGRGKEADVRIDDTNTSRIHARIRATPDGRHWLHDVSSTNGTFVNGKKIEQEELKSGDRINIGPNVVLSFAVLDAAAELMAHQLYESSVRDTLTKAYNRRYLVERLSSEVAYARRHSTRLALILFDLDHFKNINDEHGHLAGDDVLRDVAALVSRMIRVEDVFARFGGEEFVVLARGIEHVNVGRFAERLRAATERLEIASEGALLRVTISLGYASLHELPDDGRTAEGMIRLSDERLYHAKEAGRNCVRGE
jgi:diguanylate cyclase (GGDEF)-like protein